MSRRCWWLAVTAIVFANVILVIGRAPAAENQDGVITIRADGLRNQKGDVVCTLCSSADGYPGDCKHKVVVKASIMDKHADCVFPHKAPGYYGATIFHDEDGDGKFKRNLFGIPLEGFGFSNNYRPKFRAPTWDEGKFDFTGGDQTITINMIYW
jgi:uncharacterized protein (DUF2141 family)